MTLFEEWKNLIENQTEDSFPEFWKEYSEAETKLYSDILDNPEEKISGSLGELAAKHEVRPVIYMGFLDGIDSSRKSRSRSNPKHCSTTCSQPEQTTSTDFRSGPTSSAKKK